jgi:serine/threonine protein kinase
LIGKTLAHYEITALLGKGGMGEVYRARDTKLDREVALKVLPTELSGDPERAARFEREARMLASLQHPNIASIYGYEHVEGVRFLTMELVEGEDLAERLERGQVPLNEALQIAEQVAIGLEAAHQKNIIHRDLKPANIKLDREGMVKILDFGLARAFAGDEPDPADLDHSPTITAAMTRAGVILGTAAYMSPEQAKGKSLDQRSDIWSFGVILYEMLHGRKMFEGETVSETMAEVMKGEIDWTALPSSTPAWLRALLRRCLDRDPRTRLQSIGEARIAIERAEDDAPTVAPSAPRVGSARWPWLAIPALMTLAAAVTFFALRSEPAAPLVRSTLLPPDGTYFAPESPFAVSPNGKSIAFVATAHIEESPTPVGDRSIWVRDLAEPKAREIAGTSGAQYPFWSHDGRMLGFFANGKLNKVDLRGGPVLTLCDTQNGRGGTWNDEGIIVFQRNWSEGLMKIPAGGGTPEPVTTLNQENFDVAHRWPVFLPDGRRFLFFVVSTTSVAASEYSGIYVGSLDSDDTRMVFRGVSRALYSGGHLLYRDGSTLMAHAIDESSLEFTNDPVPIAPDIPGGGISWGGAHFGASSDGLLVHLRGAGATNSVLIWRDRDGNQLGQLGEDSGYWEPAISHDGTRVAVSEGQTSGDIWLHDLERGVRTRFTFDPADDRSPLWSPDDERIVFASSRETAGEIYERPSSGQGSATLLYSSGTNITLTDWSEDGRWILFSSLSLGENIWDLMAFDMEEEKVIPVVEGPFSQQYGSLSPDGKWLAFSSGESGRSEIYVQPFPEGAGRWMVSTNGGQHPVWTRDGRELIFMGDEEYDMWSVEVTGDNSLSFSTPTRMFAAFPKSNTGTIYSVSADGERMLLNERLPMDRNNEGASLIQNWPRILDR